MELLTIILKRLKSKSPKLFAWIRNVAILLLAGFGSLNLTSWGIEWMSQDVYNTIYAFLVAIAGTSQLTTTKKDLMAKDKNHSL